MTTILWWASIGVYSLMYLLSTVSICFCWNFPLIISCCVPSNDALNVKHYNITICVVILYIAHLVPNSTSRKFIKCFGCLCRLQRKYVVRRNSCKQEMYQIIIIVLPSNHGGFGIHTQKYVNLRTNDITHSYSINKWIPGTMCFWYSRGVPKVCIFSSSGLHLQSANLGEIDKRCFLCPNTDNLRWFHHQLLPLSTGIIWIVLFNNVKNSLQQLVECNN